MDDLEKIDKDQIGETMGNGRFATRLTIPLIVAFIVIAFLILFSSAYFLVGMISGLWVDSSAIPAQRTTQTPTTAPNVNTRVRPTATTHTYSAAPQMAIDPARQYIATIETPRGKIVIELLPDIAPQTVNNFVFLARNNFYNGLTWHRVLPNFMAQGGDPSGEGTGGPGYSIPPEFTKQILYDRPGIVAMARSSDPNSAGSQFFITTAPAAHLDGLYTIFGRVISGQDIVDGIPLRDPMDPADAARPGESILGITISER